LFSSAGGHAPEQTSTRRLPFVQNRFSARLEVLEDRFTALASRLPDTPEKEALSLLHAIMLETRRLASGSGERAAPEVTLEHIANLSKTAPPMEGAAQTPGLPVGAPAPDFALPDANGQTVRLAEVLDGGYHALLVFYPLDWSPACSDQLSLYQHELPEFERCRTRVVGISVDSLYSHGAWAAVRGLSFPLLADFSPRGGVAARYRVLRDDGFSDRALFVVDPRGTIRYAHVSPQLHQVPDVYALFEALEALTQE
jgi:peroxiredoxin